VAEEDLVRVLQVRLRLPRTASTPPAGNHDPSRDAENIKEKARPFEMRITRPPTELFNDHQMLVAPCARRPCCDGRVPGAQARGS